MNCQCASRIRVHLRQHLIIFFSSRRRHRRLVSDWSSGVCSSDLGIGAYTALSGYPGFEIHSFIIDAMALAVTAGLVGRVGLHAPRARLDVEKLVPPSEPPGSETDRKSVV